MSKRNLLVSLVIRARDEASGVLGSFKSKTAAIMGAVAGYFSIRAVTNFFSSAGASAKDFEEQMAVVQAVTRATPDDFARLKAAADEMGASTRYSATEAAQGLEALARAGLNADQSITALPQVLALAQGNAIGLADAAALVTQTAKGMNIAIEESGRIADVLTSAAANANTTVTGLGQGLSYVAPAAASAGYELEEIVALMGKTADAGIDATRGGTALANILAQLEDPTSRFRQELAALGITSTNMVEVLEGLEAAGPRAGAAINSVGLNAGPALRALLGQGSASIRELTGTLREAEGAAKNAADVMDNNLAGASRGFASAWDAMRRRLVDPVLEGVTERVRQLTDRIREATEGGMIDRLGEAIKQAFDKGSDALERFLDSFDIEASATTMIGWFETLASHVGALGRVFNGVAGGIQVAWNAVYQSVALVGAGLAKVMQGVVWGAEQVAAGLSKIGLVSKETMRELTIIQGALGHAASEMAKEANESYESMKRGLGKVGDALTDNTDKTRQQAQANEEAGESFDALTESIEDSANAQQSLRQEQEETARQAEQNAQRIAEAFKRQGVQSSTELRNLAEQARRDYETIKNSAESSLQEQQQMWLKWAEAVVKTNDEAAIAQARSEAAALGVGDAFEKLIGKTNSLAGANHNLSTGVQGANQALEHQQQLLQVQVEEHNRFMKAWSAHWTAIRDGYYAMSDALGQFYDETLEKNAGIGLSFAQLHRNLKIQMEGMERLYQDQMSQAEVLRDEIARLSQDGTGLARIARMNADSFHMLGEETLTPLRQAIADARREMEALADSAANTLSSVEDDLDRIRGNEEAIRQRQYERRRTDVEAQLAAARAQGNGEAVADLEKALRLLQELEREEQKQRQERRRETETRERDRSESETRTTPTPTRTTEVIELRVGNRTAKVPADAREDVLGIINEAMRLSS